MDKKVTIRDVAAKAGVSISSVHFALNGQPGVSEETRSRIRRLAQEMGYQPNPLASNLKRRTQRIAVLLPRDAGDGQYYYTHIWDGVHDYIAKANVKLASLEFPFYDSDKIEMFMRVIALVEQGELDGILTVGHMDDAPTLPGWELVRAKALPVVSISSELRCCDCLYCVQPEYDVIGRTMAELVIDHIPPFGSILLCAGNPKWEAHAMITRGFEGYLQENGCGNLIYRDNSWQLNQENYVALFEKLARPDIAAACCVYSQGTIMLGQALEESRKSERVYAVGSDLPEATADRIRRGVINTAISKNPYAQGYAGVRSLVEYLSSGKKPAQKRMYVGSEVVLKSNLVMYEQGLCRYLL